MWTVTVDSNVPIKTNGQVTRSASPSPGSGGRPRSRSFTQEADGRVDRSDVETLLSSPTSGRTRSSSVRGRPPPSAVHAVATALRSRSKSGSKSESPGRAESKEGGGKDERAKKSKTVESWREEQWKFALENAVDDTDDGRAHKLNSTLDGVMNHHHQHPHITTRHHHHRPSSPSPSASESFDCTRDRSPQNLHALAGGSLTARLPVKAVHDRPLSLLDSDSGVGSYTGRSGLSRSRSMSRLYGGSSGGDSGSSMVGSQSNVMVPHGAAFIDRSVRELHMSLEDSESRRSVLMTKLKEAQTTLELQGDRLKKIETSAKENSLVVEDLKKKEKEYRTKISQLETAEKEKQMLQMDNMRLRQEMQERINALDNQLKYLKSQHHSTESENNKRISLLDHTTMALSLLEEENSKIQQEKEKLHSEIALLRDAFCLTKTRFGALDDENKSIKNESVRLKEDNGALSRKVQEMASQIIELRSLLQAVKDENERLSTTWRSTAEDKSRAAKQAEGYQDTINDIKARLAATSADRDRLFQEKLEMNSKLQQMVLDKEQLMKAKLNLEDQVTEQMSEGLTVSSKAMEVRREFDQKEHNKELASLKKVSKELSSELSSLKSQYERSLEQVSSLESSKSVLQSQCDLGEQERRRMQAEIDRLSQALSDKSHEQNRTHSHQDEQIQRLRTDLKETRYQKNEHQSKIQELEARLAQANEGLREGTALQHSELDTWRSTCERLTSSVMRKESELQNLSDKCHEMEDTVSGLRQEIRALKDKNEILSDRGDETERLKEEVRCLLQEKAENEQMIRLLETQKSVLTKSSEESLGRMGEMEHLSQQIDKLRMEVDQLKKNKFDLEMIRDQLIHEKEEILANSESMFKSPNLAELEEKLAELREANKQLRDMNESLSHKLEAVNQENSKMSQTFGNGLTKSEAEKLQEQHTRLQAEFTNLKHEYGALDAKHQRFVINYGHDGDVAAREKQDMIKLRKERDAIQKQVTLLQGQMTLMEGSKRRAEEQISKLTAELGEARAQLKHRGSAQNSQTDEADDASRLEMERLRRELETARESQRVQEKLMKNLREESLEDVSSELQQMRSKLQELMGEIERKDQTIENLEMDLRRAKGETKARAEEVTNLREAVGQMESDNEVLRQEVLQIRNTLASEMEAEEQDGQTTEIKRSKSALSLQEELADVVKAKQNGTYSKQRPQSAFLSKSLSSLVTRPASAPPSSDSEAIKRPATEGSHRLQSLISKYRSHGDKDEQATPSGDVPIRGVKPLPGFVASKIVSAKGRSGAGGSPKAPMRRPSNEGVAGETPISPLAREDGVRLAPSGAAVSSTTRPGRKMLPPPPTSPKPTLPLSLTSKLASAVATSSTPTTSATSGTKSTFMRTMSSEDSASSTNLKGSATLDSSSGSTPTRERREVSPLASLRATLPATSSTSAKSSSKSLGASSSGLGQSLSPASLGGPDTGDQKEINALIQKNLADRFDEMAAF